MFLRFYLTFLCLVFAAGQAAAAEPVRLCRMLDTLAAASLVAEAKGFFAQEGLNVQIQTAATGKICQDNLLAGRTDFALFGDGPLTYDGFTGGAVHVLAQLQASPDLAVFARTDLGIQQQADLRGKRIGILPGTVIFFYGARLLERLGLEAKDVTFVTLQPLAMPPALAGGVVDAYIANDQIGSQSLRALGDKAIRLVAPQNDYRFITVLATTEVSLARHPDVAERLLRAFLRAETVLLTERDTAIDIIAGYAPVDKDRLRGIWTSFDHRVQLGSDVTDLLHRNAGYVIRYDATYAGAQIPDYAPFLNPAPLRAVAPDRVTIK